MICVQSVMICISLIFIIGILGSEGDANTTWTKSLRAFTVTIFSIFLIAYIIVMTILLTRLQKYFPKFYLKERGKIYTTCGIIILSIVSRVSSNVFLFLFQDSVNESYAQGTWLYPGYQLFSCLFASLFPLAAIIISLLYAVNHKKRMVNIAMKVNPDY